MLNLHYYKVYWVPPVRSQQKDTFNGIQDWNMLPIKVKK